MRAPRSSAAGLLLLLFSLGTRTNARDTRPRGATAFDLRGAKLLNNHNPSKINNEILSLAGSEYIATNNNNSARILDQQVGQSMAVLLNSGDIKDLEDLEHALSIVEYEPQKINKKEKRKISDGLDNASDIVTFSKEDVAPIAVNVNNKPKETVATTQHYPRPIQDNSKSLRNPLAVNTIKPRPSITHPSQDSHVTPSIKRENVPTRISLSHKPYSSLPTGSRRQKSDTVVTTSAPFSDATYSTVASKRKRNRNRVTHKRTNRQEPSDLAGSENYPLELLEPINNKNKNKTRGTLIKYNAAPRPFSKRNPEHIEIPKVLSKPKQEDSLKKSDEETIALNSEFENKNPPPMANYSEDLNDYLKISPVRTPVVRKLHDRKQIEQRKDDPEIKDDTLYDNKKESKRVKSESSEENDSPVDEHSNIKSVTENNRYTSQSEPGSSRIPANLDVTIPVTDTESPAMSTVTDHTPFHFDLSNYVYYPSWLSTSAPVKRTEASTIDPWFKKSRFSRRNNRYGDNSRENVDGVAEATNVENEESHETPDESHGAEEQEHQSDEYVQDDQHVTEGRKGYLNSNKHNQDDKKVHDSSSEGSHDNESQQTAVSGDAKGKGGPVKFEEGGSSERKEEHRETDGEKGEKGYKSWHEHEKANKGHHDKERHSNYFDEEDGKKKEEEEEGGYHEEHEKGEKGGKESEFDEKGKHQKGYSTKGEHSVHKKDEFEKRTEFFDEFHEDGETENDGESHHEHKSSKGGHHKVGHHKEGEDEGKYGKEQKHAKGGHHHEDKGHDVKEGQEDHHEHKHMYGKKNDQRHGKKWGYKEGDHGNAGKKE